LGIVLSPEQLDLVYCDMREILGGGGERGGKSFVAAQYYNTRFWEGTLYWVVGKDYDRCHAEFEYIAQAMLKLEAVRPDDIHMPQNGQWIMTLKTGTVIKTWSLKDWLKVGSEAPDGIIICEVAQIALQEYKRLCDRTAEKRGWVVGTGTFEGSIGWYPELWKQYQLPGQQGKSFSIPTWSNLQKFPGGIDDPEIQRLKANHPEDYFLERFGGVPCPPKGLVFPLFRYLTHVRELAVQDAPVYLWIDPGYAGAYAVEVIQVFEDAVYVVDEIYEQGLVTEQIIDLCLQKSWWPLVKGGAVDIAALQHQAMPAVAEVWVKKAKLRLATNKVEIDQGRDRLNTFLNVNPIDHAPRFFVDSHCYGLLSEFGVCPNPHTGQTAPYMWKKDRTGTIVIGSEPEDKNNHAIKAVIYGLIDKFGYVSRDKGGSNITSYVPKGW
jgi:hypothetical protein